MKKVKWTELFPDDFMQRQGEMPLVYLPLGICEPHGRIAVLGLDLIKAEWLCEQAALRYGGIVAPALGYQIHESGYHAPWLADVVGNVNAMMTGMPPHIMLHFFLYQLRAFNNAGFKAAIVLSGHAGGNEVDFRLAADCFMQYSTMKVKVFADPELVFGKFTGDHAGQYEISQLLYLQEESIKPIEDIDNHGLGQFALGLDAHSASKDLGRQIMEDCLLQLEKEVAELKGQFPGQTPNEITYHQVEQMWEHLRGHQSEWITTKTKPEQSLAPENSIWKKYEQVHF